LEKRDRNDAAEGSGPRRKLTRQEVRRSSGCRLGRRGPFGVKGEGRLQKKYVLINGVLMRKREVDLKRKQKHIHDRSNKLQSQ